MNVYFFLLGKSSNDRHASGKNNTIYLLSLFIVSVIQHGWHPRNPLFYGS